MNIIEVAIFEKLGDVLARSVREVLGVADDHPGQLAKIAGLPVAVWGERPSQVAKRPTSRR